MVYIDIYVKYLPSTGGNIVRAHPWRNVDIDKFV